MGDTPWPHTAADRWIISQVIPNSEPWYSPADLHHARATAWLRMRRDPAREERKRSQHTMLIR